MVVVCVGVGGAPSPCWIRPGDVRKAYELCVRKAQHHQMGWDWSGAQSWVIVSTHSRVIHVT